MPSPVIAAIQAKCLSKAVQSPPPNWEPKPAFGCHCGENWTACVIEGRKVYPSQLRDDFPADEPQKPSVVADFLRDCRSIDELRILRKLYKPEELKAASGLVSPQKLTQIREWVIELNGIHGR